MSQTRHSSRSDNRATAVYLPWLATSLFGVCAGFVMFRHEMWRDELQAWMIAKQARNLIDLWRNLRYEGHPGLWHLLLFAISRFTSNPVSMQVLHLTIAMGVVYVLMRFAPFTWPQKILLSGGYFFFYEYTVISRNYNLGILGLLVFCALYPSRRRSYIPLALVLFLTAQTSLMALMAVLAFSALLALDVWFVPEQRRLFLAHQRDAILSIGIILAGLAISALQIAPPADSTIVRTVTPWANSLAVIWQTYIPIPQPHIVAFWNTNFLTTHLGWQAVLAVLLLVGTSWLFWRRPLVLATYWIATGMFLQFFHYKYLGAARNHGYLFIVFVCCLWLNSYYPKTKTRAKFLSPATETILSLVFIYGLLASQVAGALTASFHDIQSPFSNAEAAASFLKTNRLDQLPTVGYLDYVASPVAGYLRKEFYYPQDSYWGGFVTWGKNRPLILPTAEILNDASQIAHNQHSDVVMIFSYPITSGGGAEYSISQRAVIAQPSIVADEVYYIYELAPR